MSIDLDIVDNSNSDSNNYNISYDKWMNKFIEHRLIDRQLLDNRLDYVSQRYITLHALTAEA
jgi:hypothetical protein